MTTRKPDDAPADDLRDARFDAAWRALSREEPPTALDDAIRAAAHREAHAGPRPVDAPAAHVPSALRPQRWWWPLAAAATIGAVAIGLLQLATPDHVGAPADDKGVLSDIPVVPGEARRQVEAAREEMPPAQSEQAQKRAAEEALAPAAPSSAPSGAAGRTQWSATPSVSSPRKDAAAPVTANERAREPPTFAAPAPPASSSPAGKPSGPPEKKTSQGGAAATAPAPAAEPFPADAAKRGAKESAPSATTLSKTERAADAGVVAGKLAEAPTPVEQAQTQERTAEPAAPAPRARAFDGAATPDSLASSSPPAAGSDAPAAPRATPSSTAERRALTRDASREAQLATSSIAQNADARSELRAKQRSPLPVPDWIALIRKLRDEGKSDDAAKELAAFRAANADHERLLPPDLRNWHPVTR